MITLNKNYRKKKKTGRTRGCSSCKRKKRKMSYDKKKKK